MSLLEAVVSTGIIPSNDASREDKKRYSEVLSSKLAIEVSDGLLDVGFPELRPTRRGPGERPFQGGLGPKKVDVSFSDEKNGLLLAVSIKSINFHPFGKNLANRFADLCTESINLHMRFPYSVVCGLFAFPMSAYNEHKKAGRLSTALRAMKLFATISGRSVYSDPPERFEDFVVMLFNPLTVKGPRPKARLLDVRSESPLSEKEYFQRVRDIYNRRNPHLMIEGE